MSLRLDALTPEDVEQARIWRNAPEVRKGLRTPFLLTHAMQAEFFFGTVCSRTAHHRYWAVRGAVDEHPDRIVAMTGLTDIQWENGLAEISLLTMPDRTGQGIGSETVKLVLAEAFGAMRLLTVFGECYMNNPAVSFWERIVKDYGGSATTLPRRKFWDGQLWDSYYFTLPAGA